MATAQSGPATTTAAAPVAAPAPAALAEPARDYVLGAGDLVRISVFQSPDLTLEARIGEGGTISYPLLGTLSLGGLTVPQAEDTIAAGLRDGQFVKAPQVSVLVLQVRGNQVSVLGFVNRPGRYPIDVNGMRLSELLALAGGVAPNGADTVTLSGTRDGQPLRLQVDLPSLFGGSAATADPVVRHGDVLFVDRMPMVYVYGEVQRPGALRLERGMTVMQGLAASGGLNQRGTVRGLRVHRRGSDGKVHEMEPRLDAALRDGDVVYVRESLF
ncbi:MAG: polysaccharide export protein EpsE [Piscinibacter sp.]|nr:polysaccharide export protein EpsE [Piscinibacter sp.]